MEKEICSQISSASEINCQNTVTSDPKNKYTFVIGETSCSLDNILYAEIIYGVLLKFVNQYLEQMVIYVNMMSKIKNV